MDHPVLSKRLIQLSFSQLCNRGVTQCYTVFLYFLVTHSPVFSKVTQVEECLLDGKILHEDSGMSIPVLEQGPYDYDQSMVLYERFEGRSKL